MLKRYAKLYFHMSPSSMVFTDTADSDAAASLDLFEPLDWHGQQQLDALSNPYEVTSLQLLGLDSQAV